MFLSRHMEQYGNALSCLCLLRYIKSKRWSWTIFGSCGWTLLCVRWRWMQTVLIWICWSCQLVSIATWEAAFLSWCRGHGVCQTTSLQCVQLHLTFSDLKLAQGPATIIVCFVYKESWLFNGIGQTSASSCWFLWCHNAEDHLPAVLCLIPPLAFELYCSRQEPLRAAETDLKPCDPWSGMCFDHALVIPRTFYEVQHVLMLSDWWRLSPACWGETRWLTKARKHIPPPHDAAMMDMVT